MPAGHKCHSHRRLVMGQSVATGTALTVVDGLLSFIVPVSQAHITAIVWGLDVAGTTSGSTSINVRKVRNATDTDMVSAVSSIAYNATTLSAEIKSTLQNNNPGALVFGDIVRIDCGVIPGGSDSAGLAVTLILHIDED